jgi:hypothetical protein
MPTVPQVEEQILVIEGFRVKLVPLLAKTKSLPSYDFTAMAPQRWRVSEWKNVRLAAYVTLVKAATVLRGDGTTVKSDLQLGTIRDSYYEAKYGPLEKPSRS